MAWKAFRTCPAGGGHKNCRTHLPALESIKRYPYKILHLSLAPRIDPSHFFSLSSHTHACSKQQSAVRRGASLGVGGNVACRRRRVASRLMMTSPGVSQTYSTPWRYLLPDLDNTLIQSQSDKSRATLCVYNLFTITTKSSLIYYWLSGFPKTDDLCPPEDPFLSLPTRHTHPHFTIRAPASLPSY